MKKYNGYDELSDRKQMQHWAGSKKFHDDNDKRIAELEKEKEEKEKRKAKDFKNTTPCYMKPSSAKSTGKKVNENSVVKLNDTQLRNIVAESVKKVLSELDWKTYANAMKKASSKSKEYDDAEFKRASKFQDAAVNAFNDKYKYDYDYETPAGDKRHGRIGMDNTDSFDRTAQKWNHGLRLKKVTSEPGLRYANLRYRSLDNKWDNQGQIYGRTNNDEEMEDVKDKWGSAQSEFDNYRKGNYAYDNEKGWHLKESVLRKMIAESVKKVLHESIKGTDPNNVVSKEIAEKFGFKPEYMFSDGLELWGKRLDFNPLEDYAQARKLLQQLGIRRFTSEDYSGHVRITVCRY